MSRVSLTLKFGFSSKIFWGVLLVGMALPMAAFAQESGPERPVNSTKLPFLREASSGGTVTSTQNGGSGGSGTNNTSGTGSTGSGTVKVEPGGLISQANNCRFKDIKGHRSERAINYLYDHGVAGGRRPCYFDPDAAATRAEAATMVVRAVEAPVPASPEPKAFPDTNVKSWSAKHVKAAKNADIVHGYPDGLYRAEKPVNVVESLKITTRGFKSELSNLNFDELEQISDIELNQWYVQYVQAGLNEGIIDSSATKIFPASEVTRAELAEMVYFLMITREPDCGCLPPPDIQ